MVDRIVAVAHQAIHITAVTHYIQALVQGAGDVEGQTLDLSQSPHINVQGAANAAPVTRPFDALGIAHAGICEIVVLPEATKINALLGKSGANTPPVARQNFSKRGGVCSGILCLAESGDRDSPEENQQSQASRRTNQRCRPAHTFLS